MQFYAKHGHYALPSKSSTYNSFAVPQVSHKETFVNISQVNKSKKQIHQHNNFNSVSKNLNFKFS